MKKAPKVFKIDGKIENRRFPIKFLSKTPIFNHKTPKINSKRKLSIPKLLTKYHWLRMDLWITGGFTVDIFLELNSIVKNRKIFYGRSRLSWKIGYSEKGWKWDKHKGLKDWVKEFNLWVVFCGDIGKELERKFEGKASVNRFLLKKFLLSTINWIVWMKLDLNWRKMSKISSISRRKILSQPFQHFSHNF